MRLLHTTTFELREFSGTDIPPYGILSHTWGRNEFTFRDFQRAGYRGGITKIDGMCRVARDQRLSWVWIDTCCIDKSSSTELSEAINSMFAWYRQAATCFVYLEDVPGGYKFNPKDKIFANSRWFSRGWTLQELLAATTVFFYDRSWNFVEWIEKSGDTDGRTRPSNMVLGKRKISQVDNENFDMNSNMNNFASALGSITNINLTALTRKFEDVHQSFSVAEKMSWASRRETTRLEDKAYSLMGLFDVNMPLLYGEGEKAFFRLQEEIIKKTDDESIFSWGYGEPARFEGGLFARSPADFLGCRNVTMIETAGNTPHYYLTNKGLHIQTRFSETKRRMGTFIYAMIQCTDRYLASGKNCIAIPLYYVGNLIVRPPGAVPLLIDEADLGTEAIYLYIHVSRSFDSFRTDFPMPGHMLRRVEKSTTVQFTSAPGNIKLAEVYPPSWYPLCTTSKSLIVVQDLASPTTSATVWMRFWDLSSGLDFALRLDLEWELAPSQRPDQLGLALVSVRPLVKLIPQDMYLFDEVFHKGLSVSEWKEKISWGDGELGSSWAQDEFEGNIRLTLPPSKGETLLTKKAVSAEEARIKARIEERFHLVQAARGLKR
ncbi:hypothetical protein CSIM01_01516 [Colletotrichum simmondsii]|uniref:Uncharacterized protein n=1 Tax=Colletotrichum simmondsii TaxID=703756 RepID=A0A135TRF0_9PEZI|nr:hypothetical protein CSIM01_01516 [Colletotrichum simmondsii]